MLLLVNIILLPTKEMKLDKRYHEIFSVCPR